MDEFFDKKCPKCKKSLHCMKVIAEPLSNPNWLGTTVFACFKCSIIVVTESIFDKRAYLQPAHFRRLLKRTDYTEIIKVYRDLLAFIEPFAAYLIRISHNSALSERAIHIVSAVYAYLQYIKEEIESQLPPRPKGTKDGERTTE